MKFLLLTLALCSLVPSAWADIYSYTDGRGIAHFSNVPDNKRYRVVVAAQRNDPSAAMTPGQVQRKMADQRAERVRYSPLVDTAARTYRVDAALLHAVIAAESGYNATAVSNKGAVGLMQLMPATARRFGVSNSFDPEQNIRGGTRYLSYLLQLFGNNLELAVAAYNAGEEAVIQHGYSIPPYRETLGYVPKVMKLHRSYQAVL